IEETTDCLLNNQNELIAILEKTPELINFSSKKFPNLLSAASDVPLPDVMRYLYIKGIEYPYTEENSLVCKDFAKQEKLKKDARALIEQKQTKKLRTLLKENPLIRYSVYEKGKTLLHLSCELPKILTLLLEDPIINVNVQDQYGHTPLHLACFSNDVNSIKVLLAVRTRTLLHIKDVQGNTPLHLACLKKNPKMVKCLLLAGADPSIVANDWKPRDMILANKKLKSCIKYLDVLQPKL
ncbi:MAG TPA: hypothetical protein DHV51_00900, partial [Opitutae bacterium]|nr:hypothetical protein [Opitutae bacterium]